MLRSQRIARRFRFRPRARRRPRAHRPSARRRSAEVDGVDVLPLGIRRRSRVCPSSDVGWVGLLIWKIPVTQPIPARPAAESALVAPSRPVVAAYARGRGRGEWQRRDECSARAGGRAGGRLGGRRLPADALAAVSEGRVARRGCGGLAARAAVSGRRRRRAPRVADPAGPRPRADPARQRRRQRARVPSRGASGSASARLRLVGRYLCAGPEGPARGRDVARDRNRDFLLLSRQGGGRGPARPLRSASTRRPGGAVPTGTDLLARGGLRDPPAVRGTAAAGRASCARASSRSFHASIAWSSRRFTPGTWRAPIGWR